MSDNPQPLTVAFTSEDMAILNPILERKLKLDGRFAVTTADLIVTICEEWKQMDTIMVRQAKVNQYVRQAKVNQYLDK